MKNQRWRNKHGIYNWIIKGEEQASVSAAFLLLVSFGPAFAGSDLESSIIIFVILYIDALDVDHATSVGFEFSLLPVSRLARDNA
jgi:hypothetical protein